MFMDLLFKRYSNPYELMDQMILCGRFLDFICEFVEITNDDLLWEYYLHYPFLEVSYTSNSLMEKSFLVKLEMNLNYRLQIIEYHFFRVMQKWHISAITSCMSQMVNTLTL